MSEELSPHPEPVGPTQPETVSDRRTNANSSSSSDCPKERSRWDYVELFLRPVSSFLTAITVALIGWFGQGVLVDRAEKDKEIAIEGQRQETIRNETAQNYRLYTELLSKREDADSALRRDMFTTILEKFFQLNTGAYGKADMSNRLLKLEMLALNFGESLSLSPLFIALDHVIDSFSYTSEAPDIDRQDDRDRLHSLAKRVADQQLSALSAGGESHEVIIDLDFFFDEEGEPKFNEDGSEKYYTYPDDDMDVQGTMDVELEGINRTYSFVFSDPDKNYKSVHVDIEIQTGNEPLPVERSFDLNYFNFPMVDNTRLSLDQRFALILTDFGDKHLTVTAISFPGKYSGQRDKPFLDDVIHRLQGKALQSHTDNVLAKESTGPSVVHASAASVLANGVDSATVTVRLVNAAGLPMVGHVVTLDDGAASSNIGEASGPSNGNGEVIFTVTNTTAELVIYTATDVTDGVVLLQKVEVDFTPVVTDVDVSTVGIASVQERKENE